MVFCFLAPEGASNGGGRRVKRARRLASCGARLGGLYQACGLGILIALWGGGTSAAYAQNAELTSRDNHALLYAHQLGFSGNSTPNIRIRIADGLKKLRFKPENDFDVMFASSGEAVVHLKGNRVYEISIAQAKPGKYQYGVMIGRGESIESLESAQKRCEAQQLSCEIVPIGSVFALKGTVFDNRENLVMTQRQPDLSRANALLNTVQVDSSLEHAELFRELQDYPTAQMTLKDESNSVQIEHPNVLLIQLPQAGATLFDIMGEDQQPHNMQLNGQLIVTPDAQGTLAVVQAADVETILRGIVPAEVYASAPEAALMAQAVAARTTLIAQAGNRHESDPYHVCNTQHCQVYRGLSGADVRTDKAIEKTRGQLLFANKKLVYSYYSSHCGGVSAGSLETWGLPDKPYLLARTDDAHEQSLSFKDEAALAAWLKDDRQAAYCSSAPEGKKAFTSTQYAHWTLSLSADEIDKRLKKNGYDLGTLKDVLVLERGQSHRVTHLKLIGSKKTVEIRRELNIRKALGGLKSALFVMDVQKKDSHIERITFYGAGFGHGVGLCQTGAIGMAQRSMPYDAILKHYYPTSTLKTLW